MSSQELSTAGLGRGFAWRLGIGVAITLVFLVLVIGPGNLGYLGGMAATAHPHAPRWELLAAAQPAIKIHLATVLTAVLLATIQMVGPKGTTYHRVMGWTLAVLLVVTAIASLFIRNPDGGWLNPFQIFSVWTLIAVPWGIMHARRHNVRRHAGMMSGLYIGAMIIAGLLTFLPGRLMWRIFLG